MTLADTAPLPGEPNAGRHRAARLYPCGVEVHHLLGERVMSGFARWGWLIAAMDAVFVLLNLLCIAVWDGGPLNWSAAVICAVLGVIGFWQWRDAVADERRWTR